MNKKYTIDNLSFEDKLLYIYKKYNTEFDTINEVRDIADYLNKLYDEGGESSVDRFFLSGASSSYKHDFKSLIIKESE